MTTFAELLQSFDECADKSPGGKFWLTEKQFNFAKALAYAERIHIGDYHNFRTYAVGKNAQYWSRKHFAHGSGRNTFLSGRWKQAMREGGK